MAARRFLIPLVLFVLAACNPAAQASPTPAATTATAPPTATATAVPPSPTAAAAFPVTVTDDEGTEVTIPGEPQKIVSLTPATTEILFTIGAGDRVVGKVEDIANFPPEAADIPVVATFSGVDVEQIVSLGADLVISAGSGLTQGDAVEQLRRANVPVVVTYPTTVDGALAGIRLIGTATGLTKTADDLVLGMQQRLDELARLVDGTTERPRVFYEIDTTGGIFTPPAESIYGEMFALAGAEPISGDAAYSISLEDLVAADPEVILLGDAAYGVTAADVAKRAGWKGMTAVKTDRIYPIDDIVVTRPGPRLTEGLEALIRAIHPDLASQLPTPEPVTSLAGLPAAA